MPSSLLDPATYPPTFKTTSPLFARARKANMQRAAVGLGCERVACSARLLWLSVVCVETLRGCETTKRASPSETTHYNCNKLMDNSLATPNGKHVYSAHTPALIWLNHDATGGTARQPCATGHKILLSTPWCIMQKTVGQQNK